MITNINPKRDPISWSDFLVLCRSCNLVASKPDAKDRYKFMFGKREILHQVSKLKSGQLRASGWFSHNFAAGGEFNQHKLTKAGHVAAIETINPHAPMTLAEQPQFAYLVGRVYISKMD
ncbi:MAG: hypothetical protein ACI9LY_002984 [Arenicella sp.]|jgi:hypothetical protein